MFSVVITKSQTFPVSHIQLMSRCAGAGREPSQTDNPVWPTEIFHTIDGMLGLGMGVGQGKGSFYAFLISVNSNPLLSGSLVFFGNSAKFGFSRLPQSLLGYWLQISHRVVRKIVLSIVCFEYSLLSLLS